MQNMASLKPDERIRRLAAYSETVDIDPNVPPRRYYRSGMEMVRMANVYLDEGSLENAYVLYLKFITLFIEKIRKHPEFASVPENVRATNSEKLREVFPKAEKLKAKLVEVYTREHNNYIEQLKIREQEELKRQLQFKKEQEEREKELIRQKKREEAFKPDQNDVSLVIEPLSIDDINYPDPSIDRPKPAVPKPDISGLKPQIPASKHDIPAPKPDIIPASKPEVPSAPKPDLSPKPKNDIIVPADKIEDPGSNPNAPSFDRGSKPNSLLSTSSSRSDGLRTVIVPSRLLSSFINIAHRNTSNNVETCGILAGKLERDQFYITHMIIPKQKGTSDSCVTMNEEEIFDFQDQHNLITLGWIHTHPTQTAFLSSVDLHTHCSYQTMMPEAIAIVCAPKYDETGFFTLTPNYGLDFISRCRKTGFHPHPADAPLFQRCEHTRIDQSAVIELVDLRA